MYVGSGYQEKFSIPIVTICRFRVSRFYIVPHRIGPILGNEDSGRHQAYGGDGGAGV